MTAQPNMYSNDQLERYLSEKTRSGQTLIPSISIEFDDIDAALSNLGKYSARIIRAVSAYSETDSDIDNDTASILLDAVGTGIEIAQDYIMSSWKKEAEELYRMWQVYFSRVNEYSEFSLDFAFDNKHYDRVRSRTYTFANHLMDAVSKNKSVQADLGDAPKKLYDTLEAITRKIHGLYGKEKSPMMTDTEFDAMISPVIDLMENIAHILD